MGVTGLGYIPVLIKMIIIVRILKWKLKIESISIHKTNNVRISVF